MQGRIGLVRPKSFIQEVVSVQREQASYLAGQSALRKKPRIQPIYTKYRTLMQALCYILELRKMIEQQCCPLAGPSIESEKDI